MLDNRMYFETSKMHDISLQGKIISIIDREKNIKILYPINFKEQHSMLQKTLDQNQCAIDLIL